MRPWTEPPEFPTEAPATPGGRCGRSQRSPRFLASLGLVGADALWLVPLGREVAHGHLPGSIPFATAASGGWHDVPALGQLVFWAGYHALGGIRGLIACGWSGRDPRLLGARARPLTRGVDRGDARRRRCCARRIARRGRGRRLTLLARALPLLLLGLLESESRSPRRRDLARRAADRRLGQPSRRSARGAGRFSAATWCSIVRAATRGSRRECSRRRRLRSSSTRRSGTRLATTMACSTNEAARMRRRPLDAARARAARPAADRGGGGARRARRSAGRRHPALGSGGDGRARDRHDRRRAHRNLAALRRGVSGRARPACRRRPHACCEGHRDRIRSRRGRSCSFGPRLTRAPESWPPQRPRPAGPFSPRLCWGSRSPSPAGECG